MPKNEAALGIANILITTKFLISYGTAINMPFRGKAYIAGAVFGCSTVSVLKFLRLFLDVNFPLPDAGLSPQQILWLKRIAPSESVFYDEGEDDTVFGEYEQFLFE